MHEQMRYALNILGEKCREKRYLGYIYTRKFKDNIKVNFK
jgi:hypothetical protein